MEITLGAILLLYIQFNFGFITFAKKLNEKTTACVKVDSEPFGQYDFIIIGAGTAGCVLANRLTENHKWKVLLIEAGGNETANMDIPIKASSLRGTDVDWQYTTVPDGKSCLAFKNNTCKWPRGKVLGGSSTINGMTISRGNRRDYDNWEKLGNTGWSYDGVLPYFKKFENAMISNYPTNYKYRNAKGKVSVSYSPFRTPIAEAINKANADFGIPDDVDYNAFEQTSTSFVQAEIRNGARDSANTAYLQPILNRNNLKVLQNTFVTKIMLNPKTKTACGVEFEKEDTKYFATISKEVILSAGVINSPQLLMLSGIGRKDHLIEMGIEHMHDLNVGDNLMDHPSVRSMTFIVNETVSIIDKRNLTEENLSLYHEKRKGPFTIIDGTEVIAFINTKQPKGRGTYPNIEYIGDGWSPLGTGNPMYSTYKDNIFDTIYKPHENKDAWIGQVILLGGETRKGTGKVRLVDKNPHSKPNIYANYFDHESDLDTLIEGIKIMFEINKSKYLQRYGSTFLNTKLPACNDYEFESKEYWRCYVRHFGDTGYHPCGTCKMGPRSDKTAVVSPELKVHDVKKLRVIDASIIPQIPAAHINAPTYMIAEKGADMIKRDHKQ